MRALELRTESDGTVRLHGLASRFDSAYRIGQEWNPASFVERVAPGAFTQSLSKPGFDCILTVEHDRAATLARTPMTLTLAQTPTGLEFDATLDMSDPAARQATGRIERGVLKECSFAFQVPPGGDRWSSDGTERTITNAVIDRGDVSLVVYGASRATGAQVLRANDMSLEERRAFAAAWSARGLGGTGWNLGTNLRRDFSAAELEALGKAGKALWIDGHWAYPTPARSDYDNAVQSVGRTPGKNRATVRRYLMKRARAEGWPIPANWNSDGSTKSGSRGLELPPSRLDEFAASLETHRLAGRLRAEEAQVRVSTVRREQREELREHVLTDHLRQRFTNSWRPKE